jgi:Flp pilus assembly pilin Flp
MVRDLALHMFAALRGIASRFTDEEGQTLAEYGLIVSVIAVAVMMAALFAFKESIVGAFDDATNCLDSASSGSC